MLCCLDINSIWKKYPLLLHPAWLRGLPSLHYPFSPEKLQGLDGRFQEQEGLGVGMERESCKEDLCGDTWSMCVFLKLSQKAYSSIFSREWHDGASKCPKASKENKSWFWSNSSEICVVLSSQVTSAQVLRAAPCARNTLSTHLGLALPWLSATSLAFLLVPPLLAALHLSSLLVLEVWDLICRPLFLSHSISEWSHPLQCFKHCLCTNNFQIAIPSWDLDLEISVRLRDPDALWTSNRSQMLSVRRIGVQV
jgi:hypothetical protein